MNKNMLSDNSINLIGLSSRVSSFGLFTKILLQLLIYVTLVTSKEYDIPFSVLHNMASRSTCTYETIAPVYLMACLSHFAGNRKCLSVNFHQPSKTCDLSGRHPVFHTNSITSAEGWSLYYDDTEPCRNEWTMYHNSCYMLVSYLGNWSSAESDCIAKGSHLLAIGDQAENEFLASLMEEHVFTDEVYIGLRFSSVLKQLSWSSEDPVSYENWADETQPGEAECFSAQRPGWAWSETVCSNWLSFVCEKEVRPKRANYTTKPF